MNLIEKINAAFAAGKTVCITNYDMKDYDKSIEITPEINALYKAPYELFKIGLGGTPMMINGNTQGKPRYGYILNARVTFVDTHER